MKEVHSAYLRGLSSPTRIIAICGLCVIVLSAIVVVEPSDSKDLGLANRQLRERLSELLSNTDEHKLTDTGRSEARTAKAVEVVEQFRSTQYNGVHLNGMLRWLSSIHDVNLRHLRVADSPSPINAGPQIGVGLREVSLRGTGEVSSMRQVLSDMNQLGFRHAVLSFDFTGMDATSGSAQFALVLGLYEALDEASRGSEIERQP